MTRSQDRLLAQWRAEPIRESKLRGFARLAKLDDLTSYLSPFVVFTAILATTTQFSVRVFPMLVCFLAGGICMLASTEMRRFGWAAALAGALLWTAAVLTGPVSPVWTILLIAVTFAAAWLSRYDLRDLFLATLGCVLVLAPYGLATGGLHPFVVVQALLFGLGPVLAGLYATDSPIARLIAALSVTEFAIGAIGSLTGAAPWWFVVAMAPVTALRAMQYHRGIQAGDLVTAHLMGLRAHRLSVLLMVLSNLLVLALA
ncbi:UbiA family prenyltransferase [Amycolatopsis lurida]